MDVREYDANDEKWQFSVNLEYSEICGIHSCLDGQSYDVFRTLY